VNSRAKISPDKIRSKTNAGALVLIALIAFGADACGRRGRLEPPPDPNAVVKPDDPSHPQVHRKPKPVEPPKVPFFLDPIL
jgi:predicted small lipoprotein YifL